MSAAESEPRCGKHFGVGLCESRKHGIWYTISGMGGTTRKGID